MITTGGTGGQNELDSLRGDKNQENERAPNDLNLRLDDFEGSRSNTEHTPRHSVDPMEFSRNMEELS